MSYPGKYMNQLIFNDKDLSIACTGQNNYVGRWLLPGIYNGEMVKDKKGEEKKLKPYDCINESWNEAVDDKKTEVHEAG